MELDYLKYVSGGIDRDAVLLDLMQEYGDDVWRFAFFLVRRPDAADDISQETFLAAYDKLHTFRGECSVKSWLLTIARNKSFKFRRNAFFSRVVPVARVIRQEAERSAEAEAFDRLETRHIWETVMQLPLKMREALLLDAHYRLTTEESAMMLGVPEGTVKSRIHRARKKLSAMLEQNAEGGDGQ